MMGTYDDCWPDDWPTAAIKKIEELEEEVTKLRKEAGTLRDALGDAHDRERMK